MEKKIEHGEEEQHYRRRGAGFSTEYPTPIGVDLIKEMTFAQRLGGEGMTVWIPRGRAFQAEGTMRAKVLGGNMPGDSKNKKTIVPGEERG